jgi:hypothetical protein
MTPTAPTTAPLCWAMYPRPSQPGWANRLVISPDGRRFHLAHNGSRLARNSDAQRLRARRPDVLAWAAAVLGSEALMQGASENYAKRITHETTNRGVAA